MTKPNEEAVSILYHECLIKQQVDVSSAASLGCEQRIAVSPVQKLGGSAKVFAEASVKARRMQHKIVWTFVFFFITCLLRSGYRFFIGLLMASQDFSNPCSSSQCHPCKNVYAKYLFHR
jgi:hypothetical protein